MTKTKKYYESLDKRTKEYKEWIADQPIIELVTEHNKAVETKELQEFTDDFIAEISEGFDRHLEDSGVMEEPTQHELREKHEANPTIETVKYNFSKQQVDLLNSFGEGQELEQIMAKYSSGHKNSLLNLFSKL